MYRSDMLSHIQYHFVIDLTGESTYKGTSKIEFHAKASQPLTVDFSGGTVLAVRANGRPIDDFKYNSFFISLPASAIAMGINTLEIDFSTNYSKTGSGLYKFTDPVDNQSYVYSDFEPYDANLFAPCFDQPDLKAIYRSTVTVPKGWTVVSANREFDVQTQGEVAVWNFPLSEKFSTYIYSLHAGPYTIWSSEVKTAKHTIPLRLMARQSMAKYVNPEEWFVITRQGFNFFENYFAYAYPYKKYDQLIVPDFNSGAMENVGAVTFNEQRFLSRGTKSRSEKRSLANVILHEMAHMWFGNLVTMKWWNDIWLNESFATIAAYIAMEQATEFKESWTEFIVRSKGSAYWTDQLVTTHPIAFDVANTDVVFANFDGITYGKGASALKQLSFYLGEEDFKKGLQHYFSTHAFKNTTLNDFIRALEVASQKDLKSWKTAWLETPQVNTIKVDYSCTDGKITRFDILQTAPKEYPTLRPHKARIAVFDFINNQLKLLKTADVTYAAAKTPVADFVGMSCAQVRFIYPNYEDYDYVKIDFDETSLATLEKNITSFNNEIVKVGTWRSLSELLMDGRWNGLDYLKTFYSQAKKESSPEVLAPILERATRLVFEEYPKSNEWTEKQKKEKTLFAEYLLDAAKASQSADVQRLWFRGFTQVAEDKPHQDILVDILKTSKAPYWLKYPIDQDERWSILKTVVQWPGVESAELIEQEKKRDSSARGVNMVIAAQVGVPDLEIKKQWWNTIVQGPNEALPLGKLRYAMGNLFPASQEHLRKEFASLFFEDLKKLKDKPVEFLSGYVGLAPSFCSTESVKMTHEFLKTHGHEYPQRVVKSLRITAQETERCVRIREAMLQKGAINPL